MFRLNLKSRWLKLIRGVFQNGLVAIGIAGLIFSPAPRTNLASAGSAAGLQLVESSDQGVLIEFTSADYVLQKVYSPNQVYDRIQILGADVSGEINQPEIPVFTTLIGVPAGVDISLQILGDQNEQISGFFRLAPVLAPPLNPDILALGENILGEQLKLAIPEKDQAKVGLYPISPANISQDAWLRDQRIIRLSVYPIQYEQSSGRLYWHRSLRLLVKFSGSQSGPVQVQNVARESPFERELEQSLLNYQSARDWRRFPVEGNNKLFLEKRASGDYLTQTTTSGSKYRVSLKEDGLYRLNYEMLSQAGFPAQPLNFTNLNLSSQGRTVAYQAEDLNADQIFGPGDGIVFYGQKFYGDWMAQRYINENANWLTYSSQQSNGGWTTWKPAMNAEMLEKYTDENVYWLDFNGAPSALIIQPTQIQSNLRINATSFNQPVYLPWISRNTDFASFRETVHIEPSLRSRFLLFNSEDTWFWDEIKYPDPDNPAALPIRTYVINLPDPIPGQTLAKFSGEIAAATTNDSASPDHHIQIYLNDPQRLNSVLDATWDGKSRFHFETEIPQARLINGDNRLDLVVSLTPNLYSEDLFLDWFQFDYYRKFIARNNEITITATTPGFQTFRISGLSGSDISVYDITNPLQPVRIVDFNYDGDSVRFSANAVSGSRYYIGKADPILSSNISLESFVNFNTPAEYIFITHADFLSGLQPLVDYRTTQGYSTLVVELDQLYNQFNDGIYNPIAIKNFLAYTFANWQNPPTYVLLVGDGHWNFKNSPLYPALPNYMPPFLNWVDPWQGEVDSANLLGAVVGADPLADVMIGRMPVNSVQELTDTISKTISYEQSTPGAWKNRLLFVADNSSQNPPEDFVTPSEHIISGHIPAGYAIDRVYLDNFIPGTCAANQPCPAATQTLLNDLNQKGAFFLNYTGHGAINLWASEQIFSNQNVANLNNGNMLPVMLSMTCLDGYWIHPSLGPALAEVMLRSANRGAVATFSPTGLGLATGHETLQAGFYDALFKNGATRLGEAAAAAKLNLYASGSNFDLLHTFTIFGDPALRLFTP